jgi:hypothetical protein
MHQLFSVDRIGFQILGVPITQTKEDERSI